MGAEAQSKPLYSAWMGWPVFGETSPPPPSRTRVAGIWVEQLLAVDLIVGDRLLAFRRHQPIDELLAEVLLYVRMLGRIDQHNAVLVKQALVAFHKDLQVTLVLER